MNITIREYKEADNEVLIKLFDEFQDYIVGLDPLKRQVRLQGYGIEYLKEMLEKIATNKGKTYIAEDDEKIVGFVMGTIEKQSESDQLSEIPTLRGIVEELYVVPSHRSQNIGALLLKKMEDYFRGQGCTVSWTGIFEPNILARNFYEKHNYSNRLRYLIKKLI